MLNVLTLRQVKDIPKPTEYDFGDGLVLRYYNVDEIDPILDRLASDNRNLARLAGKMRKCLEDNGLGKQAEDCFY
jgi:hypothetical protein